MLTNLVSLAIVALWALGTAVVAYRGSRDSAARQALGAFALLIAGWTLAVLLADVTRDARLPRLAALLAFALAPALLVFTRTLATGRPAWRERWAPFLFAATAAIALVAASTSWVLAETRYEGTRYVEVPGPLFLPVIAAQGVLIVAALAALIGSLRGARGIARLRIQWVLAGAAITSTLGLLSLGVLPALGVTALQSVGQAWLLPFLLCTTVALVRYRLLGVRTLAYRVAGWTVAMLVGAIPIAWLADAARPWLLDLPASGFVALVLAASYGTSLYHRAVVAQVARILSGRSRALEAATRRFVERLARLTGDESVSNAVLDMAPLFDARWAALYTLDASGEHLDRVATTGDAMLPERAPTGNLAALAANEALEPAALPHVESALAREIAAAHPELVVLLGLGDRLVGLLLIGETHAGRPYDAEDQRLLGLAASATSIALANELAQRLAFVDALTGLYNRRFAIETLERALREARRSGEHVGVLLVDMNEFKAVNDTLGHPAGDAVLVAASERMAATARESDLVARLGGDEFMIIARDLTADDDLERLAARLTTAIEGQPVTYDGHAIRMGASVGGTVAQPGDTSHALMEAADRALYEVKRSRRTSPRAEARVGV